MARLPSDLTGLPDLPAVDRPGPLRERVLTTLRELIIVRTLAPGQHLVESELAERLHVSRGPVREALQALHAQGWVDLRPGRGAFVHEPTDEEADEVFAVRAALESEAAALAAGRVSTGDLREMRATSHRGRVAVAAGDVATVVEENSRLHRRIADLSGIDLLSTHICSLDLRVRWFYRPLVSSRGTASWDEHDRLLDALEGGDGEAAAGIMRQHSERTRRTYRSVSTTDESAGEDPVRGDDV